MSEKHSPLQLVWGLLLVLAGVGVFFRTPQVMPDIEKIEQFANVGGFIRFCFYFIGLLLVGGGLKKIVAYVKANHSTPRSKNQRNG